MTDVPSREREQAGMVRSLKVAALNSFTVPDNCNGRRVALLSRIDVGLTIMSKKIRHARILDILRKHRVSSQDELSSLLGREGVKVTQPTLSRDIRELGLIKVRGVYQIPEEQLAAPPLEATKRSLRQLVAQSGVCGNIVMVKTSPGSGQSLGVVLDSAHWPEVLGTVAGDDTVFILLRNTRFGRRVLRRIREYSA